MSILDSATLAQLRWGNDTIQVIGLAPGVPLYRIFRHDHMDWEAPPEAFRQGRLDTPDGQKGAFAILYTAESPLTAAFEARAIRMELRPTAEQLVTSNDIVPGLKLRQLVCHTITAGALFINLEDRLTAQVFGLNPVAILDKISMWQAAMKTLVERLENDPPQAIAPIVGVAHQSKLRGSNGWNFGFLIPRHADVLARGVAQPLKLDVLCKSLGVTID